MKFNIDEIKEAVMGKVTIQSIAKELGLSTNTVAMDWNYIKKSKKVDFMLKAYYKRLCTKYLTAFLHF